MSTKVTPPSLYELFPFRGGMCVNCVSRQRLAASIYCKGELVVIDS